MKKEMEQETDNFCSFFLGGKSQQSSLCIVVIRIMHFLQRN